MSVEEMLRLASFLVSGDTPDRWIRRNVFGRDESTEKLARAVIALLETPWPVDMYWPNEGDSEIYPRGTVYVSEWQPAVTPVEARGLAVALLRAADEADQAKEP